MSELRRIWRRLRARVSSPLVVMRCGPEFVGVVVQQEEASRIRGLLSSLYRLEPLRIYGPGHRFDLPALMRAEFPEVRVEIVPTSAEASKWITSEGGS